MSPSTSSSTLSTSGGEVTPTTPSPTPTATGATPSTLEGVPGSSEGYSKCRFACKRCSKSFPDLRQQRLAPRQRPR
jgi:hypothetical protein